MLRSLYLHEAAAMSSENASEITTKLRITESAIIRSGVIFVGLAKEPTANTPEIHNSAHITTAWRGRTTIARSRLNPRLRPTEREHDLASGRKYLAKAESGFRDLGSKANPYFKASTRIQMARGALLAGERKTAYRFLGHAVGGVIIDLLRKETRAGAVHAVKDIGVRLPSLVSKNRAEASFRVTPRNPLNPLVRIHVNV